MTMKGSSECQEAGSVGRFYESHRDGFLRFLGEVGERGSTPGRNLAFFGRGVRRDNTPRQPEVPPRPLRGQSRRRGVSPAPTPRPNSPLSCPGVFPQRTPRPFSRFLRLGVGGGAGAVLGWKVFSASACIVALSTTAPARKAKTKAPGGGSSGAY